MTFIFCFPSILIFLKRSTPLSCHFFLSFFVLPLLPPSFPPPPSLPTCLLCFPLADSCDSDLELSMVRHQPEGLDQLQAQTQFTRKELQSLYRGFKNVRRRSASTDVLGYPDCRQVLIYKDELPVVQFSLDKSVQIHTWIHVCKWLHFYKISLRGLLYFFILLLSWTLWLLLCPLVATSPHCGQEREILVVVLFYCQFAGWWCLSAFDRNVPAGSWTRKLSRPFTHSSSLKEVQVVSYKSSSVLAGLPLCFHHISFEFICSSLSSACKAWSVWSQIGSRSC